MLTTRPPKPLARGAAFSDFTQEYCEVSGAKRRVLDFEQIHDCSKTVCSAATESETSHNIDVCRNRSSDTLLNGLRQVFAVGRKSHRFKGVK
jgi:hypothetical protein